VTLKITSLIDSFFCVLAALNQSSGEGSVQINVVCCVKRKRANLTLQASLNPSEYNATVRVKERFTHNVKINETSARQQKK
jgi:hypothetical protein